MRDIGLETLTVNGSEKPKDLRNYLFVIAIDRYDEAEFPQLSPAEGPVEKFRFNKLDNAVSDANAVVKALISKYKFNSQATGKKLDGYAEDIIEYDSPDVKCLYNSSAKASNISKHLQFLSENLTDKDNLLIYFAGHGVDKGGTTGFIIPFDGIKNELYKNTWVRIGDLYEAFYDFSNRKNCLDLLLILDCCFAGSGKLGFQQARSSFFSRYALVSSSLHQKASDGPPGQGSPFARALCNLLMTNTYPKSAIDKKLLQEKFSRYYVEMLEENPTQEIDYFTLPTEYGQGEFIFELKDPDVPPVDQLSVSFIRHLNFYRQRDDLMRDFNQGGKDDFIIITTMCSNFNIHKLQGKVFFEELRYQQNIDLKFSHHIVLEPDKTSSGAWEALAASKGIITTESNFRQQCAMSICGQILRDETQKNPDKPLIIYLGCNFQSAIQSESIMQFCKELYDEINAVKQTGPYLNKTFDRIILVIAETRIAETPFFKRDHFVNKIGSSVKVVISAPVEPLFFGHAKKWLDLSKQDIKSKNLQRVDMGRYFQDARNYEIENFIVEVSTNMGVDKLKLEEQLWLF